LQGLNQLSVVLVYFFPTLALGDHRLDDSTLFKPVQFGLFEQHLLLLLDFVQVQLLVDFLSLAI